MAKTYTEVLKFNPFHDKLGRFASATSSAPEGGGSAGVAPTPAIAGQKTFTPADYHDSAAMANEHAAHAYLTGNPDAVKYSVQAQRASGVAGGDRRDIFVAADVGKQGKYVMAANLHKKQAEYHRHRANNWRKQAWPQAPKRPPIVRPAEVFIEKEKEGNLSVRHVERTSHQHPRAAPQFVGKTRAEVEAWVKEQKNLTMAPPQRVIQVYGLSGFPKTAEPGTSPEALMGTFRGDKKPPPQPLGSLTTQTSRKEARKLTKKQRYEERRRQRWEKSILMGEA